MADKSPMTQTEEQIDATKPATWFAALKLYCDECGVIPRNEVAKLARDLAVKFVAIQAAPEPAVCAKRIQEVIANESSGGAAVRWRPCTGCYETEDGHPVGKFPYSETFDCEVGSGCRECGGLGVVWERWSKEVLEKMAHEPAVPGPSLQYQRAEESLCTCGAAGSRDGHTEWCQWLESEWRLWGDALIRAEAAEAALKARSEPYGYVQPETAVMLARGGNAYIRRDKKTEHDYTIPLYTAPQAPAAMIEALLKEAAIKWQYREDDDRYPRDFWHARIVWRWLQSDWERVGEQEQRELPPALKAKTEEELLNQLRETFTAVTEGR